MSTVHMYPDGSALRNPPASGGGLATFYRGQWTYTAYSFNDSTDSNLAEYKAMLKALESAIAMTETEIFTKVIIFTDSRNALRLLNEALDGEIRSGGHVERIEIAEKSVAALRVLEREGVECERVWVKGHSGVTGNESADMLARFVGCYLSSNSFPQTSKPAIIHFFPFFPY